MKLKLTLVLLTLLFVSPAFSDGGATTGEDGGHGVLCRIRTSQVESREVFRDYSLETLDLFEARTKYHALRSYRSQSLVFELSRNETQTRVCHILSARLKRLKKFASEVSVLSDAFSLACGMRFSLEEITTTHDHGQIHAKLPRYCKVVQIGLTKWVGGSREVVLSRDLKEWLNVHQLAALVLHESLHGYFVRSHSTLAVRQMVMFAFAKGEFLKANASLLSELVDQRKPIDPAKITSLR